MLRVYYPARAWHEGVCSAKSGVANRAQLSRGCRHIMTKRVEAVYFRAAETVIIIMIQS